MIQANKLLPLASDLNVIFIGQHYFLINGQNFTDDHCYDNRPVDVSIGDKHLQNCKSHFAVDTAVNTIDKSR